MTSWKKLFGIGRQESAAPSEKSNEQLPPSVTTPPTATQVDSFFQAVKQGNLRKVGSLIIQNILLVSSRDRDGSTPLHVAAIYKQKTIAELLLAKGADINSRDSARFTPLHLAAGRGSTVLVELFLANRAAIEVEDLGGYTPLCKAAHSGHCDTAELLLDRGADVNAGRVTANFTPLYWAVAGGHKSMMELLIAYGADVNAKLSRGYTPLHWAATCENRDELERLLMTSGADVNAKDNEGLTASEVKAVRLMCNAISQKGDLKQVQSLLEGTPSLALAKNSDGCPILCLALDYNREDIAKLLLNNNADVNVRDAIGRTPLHLAAQRNRYHIVELLLSKNADVAVKDREGFTALEWARIKSHTRVVEVLSQGWVQEGIPAQVPSSGLSQARQPPAEAKPSLTQPVAPLASSSVSSEASSQQSVTDAARFGRCFTSGINAHISRIVKNSSGELRRFADTYLSAKILDNLANLADEKMRLSHRDGMEHSVAFVTSNVSYAVCTLPFEYEKAKAYFVNKYGSYLELLDRTIEQPILGAQVLCHIVYCHARSGAFGVNVSLYRRKDGEFSDLPIIVAVDLLTDRERETLRL